MLRLRGAAHGGDAAAGVLLALFLAAQLVGERLGDGLADDFAVLEQDDGARARQRVDELARELTQAVPRGTDHAMILRPAMRLPS